MKRTTLLIATWAIVLSMIVLLIHAGVHFGLDILPMDIWNYLFIGIVLIILPPVGLCMMYNTRLARWGALIVALSMLGSFIYGLVNHFLLPSMDNVASPGPQPLHFLFVLTSYLQMPLQAGSALVGLWALFFG